MELGKFVGLVIGASIATVIVVSVALPIIGGATIPEGTANASAIQSMLGLVPLLLIVAIVVMVLGVALSKRL